MLKIKFNLQEQELVIKSLILLFIFTIFSIMYIRSNSYTIRDTVALIGFDLMAISGILNGLKVVEKTKKKFLILLISSFVLIIVAGILFGCSLYLGIKL